MERLIRLFHHRWAVPVLGELHRLKGAKLVTLAHRLDVSKPSLRQTLPALAAAGWVAPNPGYGHPLRPEFVLTADGAELAPACARLTAAVRRLAVERVAFKKWSMPVTHGLDRGAERFTDLKEALRDVTPRALSLALRDLEDADLVAAGARYRLTRPAKRLAPILREFGE